MLGEDARIGTTTSVALLQRAKRASVLLYALRFVQFCVDEFRDQPMHEAQLVLVTAFEDVEADCFADRLPDAFTRPVECSGDESPLAFAPDCTRQADHFDTIAGGVLEMASDCGLQTA